MTNFGIARCVRRSETFSNKTDDQRSRVRQDFRGNECIERDDRRNEADRVRDPSLHTPKCRVTCSSTKFMLAEMRKASLKNGLSPTSVPNFMLAEKRVEVIGPRNGWSDSRDGTPHLLVSLSQYVLWLVSVDAPLELGKASVPKPHQARQPKKGSLSYLVEGLFASCVPRSRP